MGRMTRLSIALGVLITVSGLALGGAGGWGPCGPASDLSYAGGIISGLMLSAYVPVPPLVSHPFAVLFWSGAAYLALAALRGLAERFGDDGPKA